MPRHLALAAVFSIAIVAPARAEFRVPQVAITGTALQSLMNAQGQTINVATDQRLPDGFSGLYLTRPSTHFFVYRVRGSDGLTIFDQGVPFPPPLYTIAPANLPSGWFTEVRFDNSPIQMVVNFYNQNSVFQGSNSVPGLGFNFLGLAITASGVFFPFDSLNPDGKAHALVYRGTGLHQGSTWLCAETGLATPDNDFDDAVFLLEQLNATPVQRTTWGTLKQRFR